jgi:hypothetical protein
MGAERLAHELDQKGSILDLPRYGTSVDLDVDLNHFAPSLFETRIPWTIVAWQGNLAWQGKSSRARDAVAGAINAY